MHSLKIKTTGQFFGSTTWETPNPFDGCYIYRGATQALKSKVICIREILNRKPQRLVNHIDSKGKRLLMY